MGVNVGHQMGFTGRFLLYPDKGIWEVFLLEIPDGPLAFSGGAWWGDLVVEPGDFCHSRVHALCECCHLTLKVDEKGILMPLADDLGGDVRNVGMLDSH